MPREKQKQPEFPLFGAEVTAFLKLQAEKLAAMTKALLAEQAREDEAESNRKFFITTATVTTVKEDVIIPQDYDKLQIGVRRVVERFNVNKSPDLYNAPNALIGHVFMSKPKINLTAEKASLNDILRSASNALAYYSMSPDFPMYISLLNEEYNHINTINKGSKWIPLITNRAKTFTANDKDIKVIERGMTFFGHTVSYGKHSEDHNRGNVISMDFINDAPQSILTLMDIWITYIDLVSRGLLSARLQDIEDYIIDYASSLYFVVTKRTSSEIVYWEKLVGMFPTKVPYSIFRKDEYPTVEDIIPIDFRYSFRDDSMNPSILADINKLSGVGTFEEAKYYDSMGIKTMFCSAPYISTHGGKYFLKYTAQAQDLNVT